MKLNILVTTDIHGNIFPTNYTSLDHKLSYSAAHLATAIAEYRQQGKLLLIDNGDAFQGTPLMTYAHKHSDTITNPMATIFNQLKYDFINLGNHDFNYGPKVLKKFIQENHAKLLTSNVFEKQQPLGQTQIVDIAGKKIAFIGVLTHYIPHWEQPDYIRDFTFEDAYEHLAQEVASVRDSVDLVIGIYHGGLERDPVSGEATENLTGENQGFKMTEIPGLDILITGHQHRSLIATINNTLVTQTTLKAEEFVVIELDLDTLDYHAVRRQTQDFKPDLDFLKPLQDLQDVCQVWLDQTIGTLADTSPSLIIGDITEARLHKHALVSFINQVQLEKTNADISAVALFNDSHGFNKEITMRDLVTTYIYPNTLVVKEMRGKTLKEALEWSARFFDLNDKQEIIVATEFETPKPQHYNYDMYDGIEYTIKVSNPLGSRIIDLTYQGEPLKDDDTFKVVVNNYRAAGGGNFTMIAESKTLLEDSEEMVDILMDYLQRYSPVIVKHHDNIKVIV